MARQYLTQAQKATVTEMAAAGHTVAEIADAVGKWPSTVRSYINGNIFVVRELQGKMPDGTPKMGRGDSGERVDSGKCPVASKGNEEETGGIRTGSVSDFERKDEEPDYKHYDITVGDELFEGAETLEVGTKKRDGENEAEGLEPESVWIQRRINALGTAIGVCAVKQVPIDVRLVAEFNRHLEEIRVYRILEGNNAGEEEKRHEAPCQGCGMRFPGCHAICLRFGVWRDALDRMNEEDRAERRMRNDVGKVIRHGYEKTRHAQILRKKGKR